MKHTTIVVTVGLALATALPTVSAQAQSAHTFVSPTGNDSNPGCSIAAPCRTFQAALAATTASGEISVLGTADYGTFTINKAISIVNGGGFEAGIMVPSQGTGIVINAGLNDAVSLRGLTIEGGPPSASGFQGATGIQFNSGQSLTVDNCLIRRLGSNGISFVPNATSNLLVSNSLVADNRNDAISIYALAKASVSAVFNRVQANNNQVGINVWGGNSSGTVNVTVYDSHASGNHDAGFFASTRPGYAPTTLMLFQSVAANNYRGLVANGGATVRFAHSMVTGNGSYGAWEAANGGVVQSYGDNYIDGNAANEGPPPSIALK